MSNTCPNACSLPVKSSQRVLWGDDFQAVLTFSLLDGNCENPVPLDMTGYTDFHACIYSKSPSSEIGTFQVEQTDLVGGVLTIKLPATDPFFANYPPATYQWQFSMRDDLGLKRTYISASTFEVAPNE